MRELQVSRSTVAFIQRGHPWVRPDRFTRGLERLKPGEAVTLIDERGKRLASALADPGQDICARVFHRLPDRAFDAGSAIRRAWERRADLHGDPDTDCYRVVHGEADFLPGLRVERLGPVLVVTIHAPCMAVHADAVCSALQELAPQSVIVVRHHTDDLRRQGVQASRWGGGALDAEASVRVRELGVALTVRPFAGLATGIYVDQRSTRQWLRTHAHGARVLNLFAYTGLFSLSLLAAGAAQAVDVDLSAAALAIAADHASQAGVADRHRIAHGDCRTVLAGLSERFDIVIVDPPTSALGGDGWVLRRDYPTVLAAAWERVAPGGRLLACCNTLHGKPFDLLAAVGASCPAGQREEAPEPAADIPLASGFPEGRPWRAVAMRRA